MKIFIPKNLPFNGMKPTFMHVDMNSCFATIEQQANPLIRGREVVVVARNTKSAVIVASSIDAKKLGIKTGMHISEARKICPKIIALTPDLPKYRYIHKRMGDIIGNYSTQIEDKSIDEFVVKLDKGKDPVYIAKKLKKSIKGELGEYITVSIGIGPNRFLAKTVAGIKKPDGLVKIDYSNFEAIYSSLTLCDLFGINTKSAKKLNGVGICNVLDFYNANYWRLRSAFRSITAYYWYLRLRGYEIDFPKTKRRTFGHSYVLPTPTKNRDDILSILQILSEKLGQRMRNEAYKARGIHLGLLYDNNEYWHKSITLQRNIFSSIDIYKYSSFILIKMLGNIDKNIKRIGVRCFNLIKSDATQLELFDDIVKTRSQTNAIDRINKKYGNFAISLGRCVRKKPFDTCVELAKNK